jgi:CRP-like cAMP-binding protein
MVYVNAPYRVPPNRVREILKRAASEVSGVLKDPEPVFRVHEFADSWIRYQCKLFLDDLPHVPDILSDMRARVWYHLHREGVSVAYPVREIRRRSAGGAGGATEAVGVLDRLRSTPLFAPLDETVLGSLARGTKIVEFGAGERVVQQGEPGGVCYVVDRGSLVVLLSEGGMEQRVADLHEGDLFGEMSLLTGAPRTATVRASTDARLLCVGPDVLKAALVASPDLAARLAHVVATRRAGLTEAKATLDAGLARHVESEKHRLGDLIRRYFRL